MPPHPFCCVGPAGADGKSAYQIALDNGFVGTVAQWLESLKGKTGPTGPYLSSYIEALGDNQSIETNGSVVFDTTSVDSVGNNIVLDPSGRVFTINRTGLYLVEWTVNLASTSPSATIGIVENGQGSSGATSSTAGNFSSGTVINVTTVPFTISLHNYANPVTIERHTQWENGAASIRIVRFADGPSV